LRLTYGTEAVIPIEVTELTWRTSADTDFQTNVKMAFVVLPCGVDERICDPKLAGTQDETFMMYMRVTIPFTPFEMGVLKFLNVAPSQIRPNSWAFIRGFEILCKALDLESTVGAFLYFYGTKDVNIGTWITISAHPGRNLFPAYALNFKKEWQDSFAWIRRAPGCSTSSITVDGETKFPLYWTLNSIAMMGLDFGKMTPYEKSLVWFLERFPLLDIHELLDRESDVQNMEAYLRECLQIYLLCFSSFSSFFD
jgi:hypothetical protein